MVFFYFGPTSDSWAVGNEVFSFAKNLPKPIQEAWDSLGDRLQDRSLAGTLISWISSSPDGSYAIMTASDELLSNRQDLLALAQPASEVDHVSFTNQGGFFIKFANGQVQLSPSAPEQFPSPFTRLVSPYLAFTGRRYSVVESVFFGPGDAVIVGLEGGHVLSEGVSAGVSDALRQFEGGQSSGLGGTSGIGRNTALCPWSSEYFFVEKMAGYNSKYQFKLPEVEVPLDFMATVIQEEVPPAHLIPRNSSSPPSVDRKSPETHTPSLPTPPTPASTLPSPPPPPVHLTSRDTAAIDWTAMPSTAIMRYGVQFLENSLGRPYLTGVEAAIIFIEAGLVLGKAELGRIWEQTDVTQDGRFDQEEFTRAMWLIESAKKKNEAPRGTSASSLGPTYPAEHAQPSMYSTVSQPPQPPRPQSHFFPPPPADPLSQPQPSPAGPTPSQVSAYSPSVPSRHYPPPPEQPARGPSQNFPPPPIDPLSRPQTDSPAATSPSHVSACSPSAQSLQFAPPPEQPTRPASQSFPPPPAMPPRPQSQMYGVASPHNYSPYQSPPMSPPMYQHPGQPGQQYQIPVLGGYPQQTQLQLQTMDIKAMICNGCSTGLLIDDVVYHCNTCSGGIGVSFCDNCHRNGLKCMHSHIQPTRLVRSETIKLPKRDSQGTMGMGMWCDKCKKKIGEDELSWHCKSFKCLTADLCGPCWRSSTKRCKHASSGRVQLCRVKTSKAAEVLNTINTVTSFMS